MEDKLEKKHESSSKGRGRERDFKGANKGGSSGRGNEKRSYGESKWNEKIDETSQRGGYNKGKGFNSGERGRLGNSRRGSHFSKMKCYHYGNLGHSTYKCPKKSSQSYGKKKIAYVQEEESSKQAKVDLEIEK